MKHTSKKSFLKLLLLGVFALFMKPVFAQPALCDDPCPPGPLQTMRIDLCKFTWTGVVTDPAMNSWNDTIEDAPYIFVIINYRTRSCDGALIIDSYVYVDNRDYWTNDHLPFGWTASPPISSGWSVPCPAASLPIKDAIRDAIDLLVDSLSSPSIAQQAVYFRGACYSLVHLSFPSGAFWMQQFDVIGGGTRWDTVYFSPNSPVTQSIPCNDACCKVTFTNDVVTLANGETTYNMRALYYESDGTCEVQPLPDYGLYPNKFEAKIWDPLTLTYNTITGLIVGQDSCELTCSQFCPAWIPDGSRPTGISSNEAPFEFSVRPTLVDDLIRFTSNKPIVKVAVYDMTGRLVLTVEKLNNNELDASELTKGPYFVQVHFTGNETRTVKILKQ